MDKYDFIFYIEQFLLYDHAVPISLAASGDGMIQYNTMIVLNFTKFWNEWEGVVMVTYYVISQGVVMVTYYVII